MVGETLEIPNHRKAVLIVDILGKVVAILRASGETFRSINPATGAVLAHVAKGDMPKTSIVRSRRNVVLLKGGGDEFVGRVAEFGKNLRVGNGLDPMTQVGPLVSVQQLDRVTDYLSIGRQEGARRWRGGGG